MKGQNTSSQATAIPSNAKKQRVRSQPQRGFSDWIENDSGISAGDTDRGLSHMTLVESCSLIIFTNSFSIDSREHKTTHLKFWCIHFNLIQTILGEHTQLFV